jgi:hypothetical protein
VCCELQQNCGRRITGYQELFRVSTKSALRQLAWVGNEKRASIQQRGFDPHSDPQMIFSPDQIKGLG